MSDTGWPVVYIIILNWNQADLTLACLASLVDTTYPNTRIILVDNGSTDDSLTRIRTHYPDLQIIENGENLGYSPANNRGIEYAMAQGADFVLLLNNDTIVAADFLEPLIEVAKSHPDIGVVSPKIYYFDQPERIWYAGGYIDWKTGLTAHFRTGQIDADEQDSAAQEVNFVSGCAMCVRRSVVEKVGLLDTRFFVYYEDTDWCARITRAGYRCMYVPQSRIWHKVSASIGDASPKSAYYLARNEILFLRNNTQGFNKFWLLGRAFGRQMLTILRYTLLAKNLGLRRNRRAILAGIKDALAGRFGQLTVQL